MKKIKFDFKGEVEFNAFLSLKEAVDELEEVESKILGFADLVSFDFEIVKEEEYQTK